jgi:hypothetical protein
MCIDSDEGYKRFPRKRWWRNEFVSAESENENADTAGRDSDQVAQLCFLAVGRA